MLLFTVAETVGFPVSLFYPIQMAWVYLTKGPSLSGFCVGLLYHQSHRFLPQHGPLPDCISFTCCGIPQHSVLEQAVLEFPQTWCRSCQSCYFRELDEERRKMSMMHVCVCVRERKRFTVSCPHHSTLEDSSPVAASNINMSSQNYKHMAAGAKDLSGYPVLSC